MPEPSQALLQPGALITLAVLVGAIALFMGGWLASEVTGLLAAGVLIASGVHTPGATLRGFGSPAMIALVTAVVVPVSAFVPNTPIVAALLPVLEGSCQRLGISPARVLLLPFSFATVLRGAPSPFWAVQ
jgi:hypothetical protein